jgi:hypothetical protein
MLHMAGVCGAPPPSPSIDSLIQIQFRFDERRDAGQQLLIQTNLEFNFRFDLI